MSQCVPAVLVISPLALLSLNLLKKRYNRIHIFHRRLEMLRKRLLLQIAVLFSQSAKGKSHVWWLNIQGAGIKNLKVSDIQL